MTGCELVEEYNAGIVCQGTPAAVAEALESFLESSPEAQVQMGAAGRRLVEDRFSAREITSRMVAVYRSLV